MKMKFSFLAIVLSTFSSGSIVAITSIGVNGHSIDQCIGQFKDVVSFADQQSLGDLKDIEGQEHSNTRRNIVSTVIITETSATQRNKQSS